MLPENDILAGCKAGKRESQYSLYQRFSPVMMGVCLRYCQSREEAEDIMQEGFIKVFSQIGSFRQEGSLEGWIRRIMVNHALNNYRKNQKYLVHDKLDDLTDDVSDPAQEGDGYPYSLEELLKAVQALPSGYRMVFNLYVFEGFSHKEIATELHITENTSKTQLMKARKYLQKKLFQLTHYGKEAISHGR